MNRHPVNRHQALIQSATGLSGASVLVVGDLMLDRFVYGDVDRISPEAPIPILRVRRESDMLGGAGNVVRNISDLGGTASLVAVIGTDSAGTRVRSLLTQSDVPTDTLVSTKNRRTGIKTRYLAGAQQLMRADHETVEPVTPTGARKIITAAKRSMESCGAVILSDYGKGVLVPDVIEAIIKQAYAKGIPVIVDPKGRDYGRYRGATLITPNRAELAEAVGHPIAGESAIVDAAQSLVIACDLNAVLVTRSQDGMTLVSAGGHVTHLPAEAQEVFDVSGAGDTVAATMATAMAGGASMVDAARLANVAAGIVVARVGTATARADDIVDALHHQRPGAAESKLCTTKQMMDRVASWRQQGFRIGFTNGCFDLLHPGHVAVLQQARNACDRLIVAINTDRSVRALKGPGRPVQNERSRATVLSSLSAVDAVTLFGARTPLKLIRAIKPDVLIKGADYTVDTVVGADVVIRNGGDVFLVPLEAGYSTTQTLEKLDTRSDD